MIVTASATAFPGEPVTTEELLSATGHRLTDSFRKSVAHMGVGRRFVSVRRYRDYLRNAVPRDLTHTTTDLGREAALSLLETTGTAENVDAVIAVTNTPARPMPGLAFDLMADLHGLVRRDAHVFNITYSGCSGFMKSMELATSLIESGRCRTVLLVVSEVHTAYWPPITQQVDSYRNVHRSGSADDLARTHQATAALLFGDGAVAFLVSADGAGLEFGNFVHLTNDRKNDAELLRMNEGGSASPATFAMPLYEMDKKVAVRGLDYVRRSIAALPDAMADRGQSDTGAGEILIHTGSWKIVSRICRDLEIDEADERVVRSFEVLRDYGNLSSVAIAVLVHDLLQLERVKAGLVVSFGVGFSSTSGAFTRRSSTH
ncbi:hypothetical protein HW532_13740 [Kaustia mangrovi]|uniref:Uncharacterized protein n=1 Tax=Kaustia mangrovi TaxID=2593653 RepID=A0A7S8C589_9HYPH|nr:3-oxoacyl-[acyl-carrier-protein] synthase III C-terminal domain-containing protein [Kaustia mangrovi]QPC43655.1 hypothetical protein HW532_13740 [Kaustia mangrovi]